MMYSHVMQHARCALNAQMGLGKTVTVLTALDSLDRYGVEVWPALVLGPKRVVKDVWPAEVDKWEHLKHLRTIAVVGTAKQRKAAIDNKHQHLYCMNYENLEWLVEALAGEWPFKTVVADESVNLKGFRLRQGGKRARALSRVAHEAKRWINLSGTPAPNGLQDLWGQMWFIDRGQRLGRTFDSFNQRWFRKNWNGFGVEALPSAKAEIPQMIQDVCLAVRSADWLPIEAPTVVDITVHLPSAARKAYDDMELRMYTEALEKPLEVFNAAAKTTKCLQMANGAVYVDDAGGWEALHDAKIEALSSIVSEAGGSPLLVAYQFKSDLARLQKAFPQATLLADKPGTIKNWNAGKLPIMLMHPQSAGHGLNLQDGGCMIAFFGLGWRLDDYEQAIERIGPVRQLQAGHPRPVTVYRILAHDTLDQSVVSAIEGKSDVQSAVMARLAKKYG